jgi:AraC family transcriptional regulator, L-rhamnose operon regulatory protein RhaS
MNRRITIEGERLPLPELLLVGHARFKRARFPGVKPHFHPDAYEIFYIVEGEAEWWVEREVLRGKANHIFINKPGEFHGSLGPALKPCRYYWFQLALSRAKPLPGLTRKESATLNMALSRLKPHLFEVTSDLGRLFADLFEECLHPGPSGGLILRSILHLLLGRLLRLSRMPRAGKEPSFAVRQAMRWVASRTSEPVAVPQWAAAVGLSVSHFRERFFCETGFSPSGYLCRLRIDEAKKLLRAGSLPVTSVAHEMGFSSSQYFATVFKRMEGLSPMEFRRRMSSGSGHGSATARGFK